MKLRLLLKTALLIVALVCLFPKPAAAYVGPGAGLSAIGAFLAIFVGLIVAVLGFLWYPIKRLLRTFKKRNDDKKGDGAE